MKGGCLALRSLKDVIAHTSALAHSKTVGERPHTVAAKNLDTLLFSNNFRLKSCLACHTLSISCLLLSHVCPQQYFQVSMIYFLDKLKNEFLVKTSSISACCISAFHVPSV